MRLVECFEARVRALGGGYELAAGGTRMRGMSGFRPAEPSEVDALVALIESAYRGESSNTRGVDDVLDRLKETDGTRR